MGEILWVPPLIATLVFLVCSIYLLAKNRKFSREVDKFNRRKSKFLTGLAPVPNIQSDSALPELKSALAARRSVIGARTKKRELRQRRLVEHLKDLQAKESE